MADRRKIGRVPELVVPPVKPSSFVLELDPAKTYVVLCDQERVTVGQVDQIKMDLGMAGIEGVVILTDPEAVKIMES